MFYGRARISKRQAVASAQSALPLNSGVGQHENCTHNSDKYRLFELHFMDEQKPVQLDWSRCTIHGFFAFDSFLPTSR